MAKCPLCKTVMLESAVLESALPVMSCPSCGGSWLRANEYTLWLKSQHPGTFDEEKVKEARVRFPVVESNLTAICPDCGRFLRKFRISAKVDFHLDRCNHCNGVWLEKNEWESLKTADLHDEINKIFTKPWQQEIHDKSTAVNFDAMYLAKFGPTDYARIKEVRAWLQKHPNRNALIAFLLDKDPFGT